MKIGVMQPYFFPYLGHFALIASVDEWVVFDVTQYTPKTWMNRNRILHPKEGWQYVTVPLANSSISIKTFEAKVLNLADTKQSIIGKLSHYKKHAPYFYAVNKIVRQAFDTAVDDSLVSVNVSALISVCEYLGIPFSYKIASQLIQEYPKNLSAGEWAPFICKTIGATEYFNPMSGRSLFEPSVFEEMKVSLNFSEFSEFKYITAPYQYEPHLSILDVMMWNSPEEITTAIKQGTTLLKATTI